METPSETMWLYIILEVVSELAKILINIASNKINQSHYKDMFMLHIDSANSLSLLGGNFIQPRLPTLINFVNGQGIQEMF